MVAGLLPVDRHHHLALSGFEITFQMKGNRMIPKTLSSVWCAAIHNQ